jgi:phytoene/squalene synthetase
MTDAIRRAYRWCRREGDGNHLPGRELLIAQRFDEAVAVLTAFGRVAQGRADAVEMPPEERHRALESLVHDVREAARGRPGQQPLAVALSDAIPRYDWDPDAFETLVAYWHREVDAPAYPHFGAVIEHGRYVAAPVARLALGATPWDGPQNRAYAESLVTGVWLIRRYQSLASDLRRYGRLLIPTDELERFKVSISGGDRLEPPAKWRLVMSQQYRRAERLLRAGAPLGLCLPGLLGLGVRRLLLYHAALIPPTHAPEASPGEPRKPSRLNRLRTYPQALWAGRRPCPRKPT